MTTGPADHPGGARTFTARTMTLVIQQEPQAVRVPEWVTDLCSFRRWARSDDFPTRGWYSHLAGELWVDANQQRVSHSLLRTEMAAVLARVTEQLGVLLSAGMLLTNVETELSTEPDGIFISYEALKSGRARFEQGEESVEVEGTPDMVLEVVSPSSRQKDTTVLRDLYWRAGVKEYWLAEPGRQDIAFDILKHGSKGYTAVRKQAGWSKSSVFGKSFRLLRKTDPVGNPLYTLEAR